MDYKGAVESFQKALEANPRSAAAHFELGYLYDQKVNDYAAAVYHYEQYLRLRPSSDKAEIIRPRITACKMELAKTVSFGLVSRDVQKDLERFNAENAQLKQQIELLRGQVARFQALSNAAQVSAPSPVATNPAAINSFSNAGSAATAQVQPARGPVVRTPVPQPAPIPPEIKAASMHARTYTVKPGDTAASIAKRNGVPLSKFLAANPGMEPKRIRPGQILNLPK